MLTDRYIVYIQFHNDKIKYKVHIYGHTSALSIVINVWIISLVVAGNMEEVDQAFIQNPENRPKLSITQAEGIPVINLSPIIHNTVQDSSAIQALVKEISSACKEWGFFQVTNHGVPPTLRLKMEEASKMFFAQSLEDKKKITTDDTGLPGYHDTEHTKNVRDWKEVFDFLSNDPTLVPLNSDEHDDQVTYWTNPSPQYPPHFK